MDMLANSFLHSYAYTSRLLLLSNLTGETLLCFKVVIPEGRNFYLIKVLNLCGSLVLHPQTDININLTYQPSLTQRTFQKREQQHNSKIWKKGWRNGELCLWNIHCYCTNELSASLIICTRTAQGQGGRQSHIDDT